MDDVVGDEGAAHRGTSASAVSAGSSKVRDEYWKKIRNELPVGELVERIDLTYAGIERWIAWQGVEGEIDARNGGVLQITMPGGQVASGRFIEVIPEQRLVFTWGWEGEAPPVPPGSTTVVIELEPDGAGTLLRLTHSALAPPPVAEHHRAGWESYLERLKTRAEGGDPGPDHAQTEGSGTAPR